MILPLRVFGRSCCELDLARRNGGAEPLAREPDELAGAASSLGSKPGLERDERLDHLADDGVRDADDAGLGHRRVLHECALDLERPDEVAGGLDDVVTAADEPVPAVGVATREVAGAVPVADERCAVALVVVQVAAHHRRPRPVRSASSPSVSGSLTRTGSPSGPTTTSPIGVTREQRRLDAGHGTSHRSGTDLGGGEVRDHDRAGLGLPPRVVDRPAEDLLGPTCTISGLSGSPTLAT